MTAPAQVELALRLMRAGNLGAAIEHLRGALAEDPDHAAAHAYLALCLNDTGRRVAARHEAGLALGLAPELPFVHYVAGVLALERRDYKPAEAHLSEARALEPDDAYVHRSLARLYGETERRRLALPALLEGLRHAPEDVGIISDIGTHLLAAGDIAPAEARALEALRIDPESADANALMGQVRLRQGDIRGAREHALIALRRDATHGAALHLMCQIKMRANPLLGLWWRYAVWMGRYGATRSLIVIIGSYIVYRLAVQGLDDVGYGRGATLLIVAWLVFCAYTWAGSGLFQKALEKELKSVRLRGEF